MLPVRFAELPPLLEALCAEPERPVPEGLWLTPEDYRALEINILRLRTYQAELLDLLDLYQKGEHPDG